PEEPKDLDFVIGAAPEVVDDVIADWVNAYDADHSVRVQRTRLGGYRLVTPSAIFDVWAAPATVSLAKGRMFDTNIYRAVAKSAVLSLDSLVVTSRWTLYDNGFFATLRTGLLRMNYCHIDQGESMARKAVRLCETYRLMPDLSLQSFIASVLGTDTIVHMQADRRGEPAFVRMAV
ncbi:MAG TPA: hypothetical protein VK399_02495, partial [Longimicrobiaceae bacterium]|nr:hypothetical protein [Longimicrobiaceae bacterium]